MPAEDMEIQQYKTRMRELSKERKFRARFRNVTRQTTEQVERQLSELQLNTHGIHRTKAERLFRDMLRVLGVANVPWYPERDEADEATLPEEEEWLIEPGDTESEIDTEQRPNQRTTAWPSNGGLPPSSEWTATITENQPAQ